VKVRDVIKALEREGWVLARTRGDHRQYILFVPRPVRLPYQGTPVTICRKGR